MKTGFKKFSNCLNLYMELLNYPNINDCQVNIYKSVILENGAIMRADNSYYGSAWFSDVAISMNSEELDDYVSNQGICYGLVTESTINNLFYFYIFYCLITSIICIIFRLYY